MSEGEQHVSEHVHGKRTSETHLSITDKSGRMSQPPYPMKRFAHNEPIIPSAS